MEQSTTNVDHVEKSTLNDEVAEHAKHGDAETEKWIAASATDATEIDAATSKRLFWKINRRVLVIMLITYFCQSLDKGTLNFSSIMGIQKDAHLHGQQVISLSQHRHVCLRSNLVNSIPGSAQSCTWVSWLESTRRTSCFRNFLLANFLRQSKVNILHTTASLTNLACFCGAQWLRVQQHQLIGVP